MSETGSQPCVQARSLPAQGEGTPSNLMDASSSPDSNLSELSMLVKDSDQSLAPDTLGRSWEACIAAVNATVEPESCRQALNIMRMMLQMSTTMIQTNKDTFDPDISVARASTTAALARMPDAPSVLAEACVLLASLTSHGKLTPKDIETTVNVALSAAEVALQRPNSAEVVVLARSASWSFARTVRFVCASAELEPLATRITLTALRLMSSARSKDDPSVAHCLDVIAAVLAPLTTTASTTVSTTSQAGRALASTAVIGMICEVAGNALDVSAEASALRALWHLLTYSNLAWPENSVSVTTAAELREQISALLTAALSTNDASPQLTASLLVFGHGCLAALAKQLSSSVEGLFTAASASAALSQALAVLPNTFHPAVYTALVLPEDVHATRTPTMWAEVVPLEAVESIISAVAMSSGAASALQALDRDGFTLLHRLAAMGNAPLLSQLLASAGNAVDVLLRTRDGATALQLARLSQQLDCVAMLEDITQRAFEARQDALLRELEEDTTNEESEAGAAARKGRKKKSVTRSASFAAEQPEGKSQRLNSDGDSVDMTDALAEDSDIAAAAAEAAAAQMQRELERQRLEDEYEQALEARRRELEAQRDLAAQQAAAATEELRQLADSAAAVVASDAAADGTSDGTGEGRSSAERPSTPTGMVSSAAAGGNGNGSGVENTENTTGSDIGSGDGSGDVSMHGSATASVVGAAIDSDPSPFADMLQQQQQPQGTTATTRSSPPMEVAPVPTKHAAVFAQSQRPTRQHSLFGSPSLTGDLFPLSPHSLGTTTSASLAAGSPGGFHSLSDLPTYGTSPDGAGTSPSLAVLRLPPTAPTSLPMSSSTSAGPSSFPPSACAPLQDALFVQNPLLPSTNATSLSKQDAASDAAAALFSSLTNDGAQVVPQAFGGAGLPILPLSSSPSGTTAPSASSDDESLEPTRHLWIGNLCPRAARPVLKAVFERFGTVDDVVTFPGRMYAFVNFRLVEEAASAMAALQERVVPELTRDRALLLKYRPVKKAAMHLRALGLAEGEDTDLASEIACGIRGDLMDRDGNSSDPSPRLWLGNIAPTATAKSLQTVLGRFGPLSDAAVFPARIGPLGYAFVKFETLEDAVRAYETLNNTVVPALSGTKQLKMRYKPGDGPSSKDEVSETTKSVVLPSRHLWLGNITQKPSEEAVFAAFSRFGRVDSARVFPAKAYAFVNFSDVSAAARAMAEFDGVPIPALTGVKPLVMRFQQEAQGGTTPSTSATTTPTPTTSLGLRTIGTTGADGMNRVRSESALALAASLNQLVPGGLGALAAVNAASAAAAAAAHTSGTDSSSEDGAVPRWNGIHRSQSVGFLGGPHQHQHQRHHLHQHTNSSIGCGSNGGGLDMASYNTLLQGLSQSNTTMTNNNSNAPSTSASSSQLSAVLNNLTALHRAASGGLPPPPSCAPPSNSNVQHQLLQLSFLAQQQQQQQHAQQSQHTGSESEITRLSTMLAGQSLTPSPVLDSHHHLRQQSVVTPDAVLCPLSGALMTDPVMAADGITYNRSAITEWMSVRSTSPVTQAPLPNGTLVPNAAIKNAVMNYLRARLGGPTTQTA